MYSVIVEILLSLFFVYGVFSATTQIRLLVNKIRKRHSKIDKQNLR